MPPRVSLISYGAYLVAVILFVSSLNSGYNAARLLQDGVADSAGVALASAVRWAGAGLAFVVAGMVARVVQAASSRSRDTVQV